MDVKNNKRYRETTENINTVFLSLLQEKELLDITVTDICELAGIERSAFYAYYEDVSALANDYAARIEKQVSEQPRSEGEFAWIFEYIKGNPDLFKTYFKLGVSKKTADYKNLFFRNGVYAVAKMWFEGGCIEPPEQMGEIVKREHAKLF